MNARRLVLVALSGLAVCGMTGAAVGEGREPPASPWRAAPRDVVAIEAAKQAARRCQTLTLAGKLADDPDNDLVRIRDVGITPQVKKAGDLPAYEFAGRKVSVSFANVEHFVVKAKSDTTITLTVTVWPDISPEDLLEKQPTWKELKKGFRRDVDIEIPIETSDGRALEFAGAGPGLAIEKLPEGAKGDFYGGSPRQVDPRRFWWAIPSVTKDPAYPFRAPPGA